MSENSIRVNKLILDVIENQLRMDNPPQTRETLERLMESGLSEEEAKRLIGTVIVVEMRAVVSESKPFNVERFVAGLQRLPEVPS